MTAPTNMPRFRGRTRRDRRPAAVLIVSAVLIGVLALALWWAVVRGPLAPKANPDDAPTLAASYLAAWVAQDWLAMESTVADAPEDFISAHETWQRGLRIASIGLDARPPFQLAEGLSVPFDAQLELFGLGEWSYQGTLRLVDRNGEWKVDWSPATLHPELREGERLVAVREWAPRADLLAADGSPLVTSRPVITVGVVPERIEDLSQLTLALDQYLDIAPSEVLDALEAPGVQPDWFLPLTQLRPEDYASVQAFIFPVPGTVFRPDMARISPAAGFAAHVLGSVGEVTAELLDEFGDPYVTGDLVGRSGLERRFEQLLAGHPSGEVRRVAADGTVLEVLHRFEGLEPEPVQTTLGIDAQAAAELALSEVEHPAAFAAVDVGSGEIRALVARPHAGFNRALTGLYPPGSTFKVITLHGLLADGLSPADTVACPAEASVGGKTFRNAAGFGPGETTLAIAFAESCNTTFAPLGSELETLTELAEAYGFNINYTLALPTAGARYPVPADIAERASAAIGQGRVQATPLHMASALAAVRSGVWRSPRLVSSEGPEIEQAIRFPALGEVAEMLRLVVTSGTGAAAAVDGEEVSGKTGTAQFGEGDPPEAHAWFVGLHDDLAFAVFVEGGGSGGEVAAPIGARFIQNLRDIRSGALQLFGAADCALTLEGWPTFQGSGGRQGCVERRAITTPELAWSTEVGQLGWLNNPVVAGERIFVGSAGNLRFDPDSADGVYALDLSTGSRLWRFSAATDVNGVAVADGVVTATGDEGRVWALDAATGAELWSRATWSGGPMLSNPLVVGGLVVVGDTHGIVYAIDQDTGSLRWQTELDGAMRGGAATDGESIYVVGEAGDARAFDFNGSERWSRRLTFVEHGGEILTARVLAAPTVAGDLLVVPFVRDTSYEDPALIAIDRHTGIIRWKASDPNGISPIWANLRSSPALANGQLVFGQPLVGALMAVSTVTGEAVWAVETGAVCDEHWASPAVVGTVALHGRSDGSLYGVDTETGTELWSFAMNLPPPEEGSGTCIQMASQPIHSSPAVAEDGTVIVGSLGGELAAIGDRDW